MLNLIEDQPHIDKTYLYAKNLYKAKHQYLLSMREKVRIDHFDDLKAYIEYSMICVMFTKILMNTMQIQKIKH